MKVNLNNMEWIFKPNKFYVGEDKIEIISEPCTDLWQRTYYHFRNDNAPMLLLSSSEKYFSFVVKTRFESKVRFDQSGIIMYLDSNNWIKASVEYENDKIQRLGSVVTNNGYSDWASTYIDASIKEMWFRFSRRDDDFCIENSLDGINYKQMRIAHMFNVKDEIRFGVYACSPEKSSFKAEFTNLEILDCVWLSHDGQAQDADYKGE